MRYTLDVGGADYAIVAVFLIATLAWGAHHARRAGSSMEEFFVAGRALPWWLAGTSIVATTFAADTPLAVAGLIATDGVAGNWFWWADVLPAVIAALVVARLWRRSGVLTDAEITELRYGGARGAALRVFRALYFGVLRNAIVIGWVNLAMLKVLRLVLELPSGSEGWLLAGLFGLTLIYTLLSGLWGVVFTDVLQFTLAMLGSIALAVIAVGALGGLDGLLLRLQEERGPLAAAETLSLIPVESEAFWAFAIYLFVKSWASGNSEGSGYVAQRLLATRDERHARLAALWYVVANFVLRPWPWILVGLVALVDYPELADPEEGYVRVMLEHLPLGLRGLMVATLLAAFMSTIDTHLNWGASYLTSDIYRRFLRPDADERRLVRVARLSVVGLAALGALFTLGMSSISGAWKFLASISAGLGLISLLRWLWWRVNAWSEIVVMTTSLIATNALLLFSEVPFPQSLALVVVISVPASLVATALTKPEPPEVLSAFYARLRPPGWWGSVASADAGETTEPSGARLILEVLSATGGVYGLLAGLGWCLLGRPWLGAAALGIGTILLVAVVASSAAKESRPAPARR
jgi:SSS family solute:Na+ symporter